MEPAKVTQLKAGAEESWQKQISRIRDGLTQKRKGPSPVFNARTWAGDSADGREAWEKGKIM